VISSIEFHAEARAEYLAAIDWYSDHAVDLGDRFEAMVTESIDGLAVWPQSAPIWPGWARTPVVRALHLPDPWPYRVVYFVVGDQLRVVAIAHDKRLPGYWRDRVAGS
jgi:hypothetical protein